MVKYFLLFITSILFLHSCKKEQACHIPTDITAKVEFGVKYTRDTIIVTDSLVRDTTIIVFRDTLLPAPAMETYSYDTNFIIRGARGVSVLPFSLDPDQSSISYVIYSDYESPNYRDTLTVYYQSKLFFISNDCGFTYNYLIDSAKLNGTQLDSLSLQEPEVTTSGSKRHIRLYYFD